MKVARNGAARPVVVTGATGFIGRHVARRLMADGVEVINLTGHPGRRPREARAMATHPLAWDDSGALVAAMRGADTLVNTYWVRFQRGEATYARAVERTHRLMLAAATAGVERVVHLSITNPSADSPLPYFAGKAAAEDVVRASGLRWAIVRPTWVYGPEDILVNNIAWCLRHLPAFGIPGDGTYSVQPVHVSDLAARIVELCDADLPRGGTVVEAAGPERYTFDELARVIRWAVGARAAILLLPPSLAVAAARVVGLAVGDVLLTMEEVRGLMAGLLVTDAPPVGRTSLAQWLVQHRDEVGRGYASELAQHYRLPEPAA